MAQLQELFAPQTLQTTQCVECEFHLKGCCFDPRKKVKGFLASPCFGCLDVD